MTPKQSQARHAQLVLELRQHDERYYADNAPTVSDAEYDALLSELRGLETHFPQLITTDSPTQKVGGTVPPNAKKIAHGTPMLSLYTETDFTDKGAYDFTRRVSKLLIDLKISTKAWWRYVLEPKFDGLAVSLRYQDGHLVSAGTRGDGAYGEDVTANVRKVQGIPQAFDATLYPGMDYPREVEVRGEVMMPRSVFARINAALIAAGEAPYVNARNAAAGSLRLLNAEMVAQRGLVFFAYGIGQISAPPVITTQNQLLKKLTELGFNVYPGFEVTADPEALVAYHQKMLTLRPTLDFDIDGVVYKLEDLGLQAQLGCAGREPRWATAHKFEPEKVITTVLAIEVQVGRTGKLTPVAKVEPVFVGGVTVSSVTLHNADEIQRLGISVGSQVVVQRAGDVIPQITEVLRSDQPTVPFTMPTVCPECGSPVTRSEGQVDYRCTSKAACPAQGLQKLIHFCSRKGLAIDGFGEKILEQLYQAGIVEQAHDLFSLGIRKKAKETERTWEEVMETLSPAQRLALAQDTLRELEGVGERLAKSLLISLQQAKATTLPKLLYALGIRHASEGTAKRLTKHFGALAAIQNATQQELEKIDDIGEVVASSLVAYFSDPTNTAMLAHLVECGVDWPAAATQASDKPLSGLSLVITGTQPQLSREQLTAQLEAAGASVSTAVTKATDYLVVGDKPGKAKVDKAKALSVPWINMARFEPEAFEDRMWYRRQCSPSVTLQS